jgi:hypothetical protein
MAIKKITDALVESCVSMNKKGILSPSALEKCKLLEETNVLKGIYDSDPLEKKLYKKNIDTRKNRYLTDFNINKKNIENSVDRGELETLKSELLEKINKLKQRLQANYGNDKYKELVNLYKIIEENRIKELETERNISTNKQKLIYNKSSNEKFVFFSKFFLFLFIILLILFIILLIIYFYRL